MKMLDEQLDQLMKWSKAAAISAFCGEYYGETTDEHQTALDVERVERLRLYEVFGFMEGPDGGPQVVDPFTGDPPAWARQPDAAKPPETA